MSKGLVFTIAVGFVAMPQGPNAQEAQWAAVATLEKGGSQCGSGQSDWLIRISGTMVEYLNITANRSSTVDLNGLQPDGSGKLIGRDDQNREFYVAFESGSGPRVMRSGNSNNDCVWIFTPKK